jgi:hypothetical protein
MICLESNTDEIPQTAPKKRGRKPKNANLESDKTITVNAPPTEPKRRGRKPTCQVINNVDIVNMKKDTVDDCLFIHLPLNKNDIEKVIKNNIDDISLPKEIKKINLDFEDKMNNSSIQKNENIQYNTVCKCTNCDKLQETINEMEAKLHINKLNSTDRITYNINVKLEDIYTNNDVWENTNKDVCCWWCSHTFDTLPLGLPEKYYDKKFHVIGNFCSFNCAMAFNLSLNDHKIWDRVSLLYHMRNMIYLNIYPNRDVKKLDDIIVAPPRSMLKMFGGSLTIENFRERSIVLKKQYRNIIPPIVSLTQPIEETTYNQDQNQIIKQPKLKTLSNLTSGLVLKRSKPVTSKSSLYNLMKIQQVSET